jgi:predicted TIM-barrel fold metal-dependent hydrolase
MTEARVAGQRVIDACAFHDWASNLELVPYLSEGWGELVKVENLKVKGMWQNEHPLGGKDPAAKPPTGGPHASDPEFLIKQLLEERGSERIVLGHQEGLLSAALPLPYEARALVRALNDWTLEQWLERDERLYGHILVTSAMPDEAAAEIRRVGQHEKFVAVALGANGLNKPFGHPAYHPIYEAAAELGLPVVIQVGADNIADLGTSPTAVGLNTTYSEFDAMSAAPLMPHITSFFTCGVFDLYPGLQLLVVGGGLAWIPQYLWRFDWNYKMVRRVEVPWAKRMPSEYLAEHVRFSTYSMETPPKEGQLETMLELIPGIESMLLYASGYPYSDGADATDIAARLPESMHDRVFHGNAEVFYRWPGQTSSPAAAASVREEIASGGPS